MRFMHELDHEPAALQPARAALEVWCISEHVDPESLVIIANELCSNAIRHGEGPVTLQASCSLGWASLSVHQRGRVELAMPRRAGRTELQVAGRGLLMVDALAESWGWNISAPRTLVWARIARQSA
ncbi:MAG: ATP-binding protein [Actinomycetota bacterium]|nr:ATP-binding protein [Actinomycetota bacterium]